MARGLFIEPFFGGSHRAFGEGLAAHGGHDLTLLTLPGGEWRKRMRLGAQVLAAEAGQLPGSFDFVIATDMLDLPAFLALTRPRFGDMPVLLFMHENQLTYPRLRGTKLNSWFGQINYLSALAADVVAFNSAYHRNDFLGALRQLAEQPNNWLDPAAIDAISDKSRVLPVGVDLAWIDAQRPSEAVAPAAPPLVLWNHRWEFDKAPEPFVRAVTRLAEEGVAFRLAIAGSPGDNPSAAMLALPDALGERVIHFGHLESREAYARLLWDADIVVSSARHEFFGVAMVEALYAGCAPVVPARYNYPHLVPEHLHDRCLFATEEELVERLRAMLAAPLRDPALRASAGRFCWEHVGPEWERALTDLVSTGPIDTFRTK